MFSLKPILYKADATNFNSQGIGVLKDAVRQKIPEERNGIYEYEFDYPADGLFSKELMSDRIVKIDASKTAPNQRFRIVNVRKKEDGWLHIYCQHVSYETMSLGLKPDFVIPRVNASQALEAWRTAIIDRHPFTTWSNIGTLAGTTFGFEDFENPRQALGGVAGSILDRWGGEYEFDNYEIKLWGARGAKRNVVIAYGKNLRTLEQEEQIQSTYTTIYPYARVTGADEDTLITLPEYYVDAPTAQNFSHRRVMKLDCSEDNQPVTEARLREVAKNYISNNDIGYPKISLDVSYLDLSQTLDYAGLENFEEVNLCDTVTIYFEKLGVNVDAKVTKVVYDPDIEQYTSIELGDARYTLGDKLSSIENVMADLSKNMVTSDIAQSMIDYQTQLISGARGGSMIIRYSDEGLPYELLFLDTDNVNTARECLRINRLGIGFSTSGWQGPFTSAWTIDGRFNANFIRVGQIAGPSLLIDMDTGEVLFQRGAIQSSGGDMKIDITNGIITSPIIRSYRSSGLTSGIEIQAGTVRVVANGGTQIGALGTISLTGGGTRLSANQGNRLILGTENNGALGNAIEIPTNSTQARPVVIHRGESDFRNTTIMRINPSTLNMGLGQICLPSSIRNDGTVESYYQLRW